MTTASYKQGDFSIKTVSKAKTSGNKFETIHTGSGTGVDGNLTFQSAVFTAVSGIINNYYGLGTYVAPTPGLDTVSSDTLHLIYLPSTVVQTPATVDASVFRDFLLKVDSLTLGTTTPIVSTTDDGKLIQFITDNAYMALQNAAKTIVNSSSAAAAVDFCATGEGNGEFSRYQVCIDNCVFTMIITIH